MATISFDIPNAQLPRAINALTLPYGLDPTAANAKSRVIYLVRQAVREYEGSIAAQAAIAAVTEVDAT